MIEDAFVNLYCHSVFSFNQSLVTPEGLAEEASDKLMPSVAITDNCNLHGAVRFAKRSAELGIKPIIGCEFPGSVLQGHGGQAPGLILICKDGQGYRNLCRLVSLAQKAAASDNVISRALLCFLTKGLIAISPRRSFRPERTFRRGRLLPRNRPQPQIRQGPPRKNRASAGRDK